VTGRLPGRAGVTGRLLARARSDEAVTGAAWTGSRATGSEDRWSDTGLVLAVRGDLAGVAGQRTRWLEHWISALRDHVPKGLPAAHKQG
jgi:hypothetical protein